MSSDIRGLWSPSSDPTNRFVTALANKLTKFLTANQVAAVENDNEDIYSNCIDVESSIKFHTFNGQHRFQFNKQYFPTFEPDYNKVKCWIRARNAGNTLRDLSGFDNNATIAGDPLLVDGKFDQGLNTTGVKSLALRLNRTTSPYENQEYISVRDSQNTQIDELVTGFSEFIRFKAYSIADNAGLSPTLFAKVDSSGPTDARMLQIRNDGALMYVVVDGGITYTKRTAADTIIPNTFEDWDPAEPLKERLPYDVFTTYNASTHAIVIYVNGVSQTLSDTTAQINWQNNTTLHNFDIFRRGNGSTGGYLYGDFYDYRYYAEKIVSSTEVSQMYANKWTISNIPFSQCMVVDHFGTYAGSGGAGTASFDPISFDPISFTT